MDVTVAPFYWKYPFELSDVIVSVWQFRRCSQSFVKSFCSTSQTKFSSIIKKYNIMGARTYFDGAQFCPAFVRIFITVPAGIKSKAVLLIKSFVERSHILMAILRSEGDSVFFLIVSKIFYKIVPEEACSIDETILRLCPMWDKGHQKNK